MGWTHWSPLKRTTGTACSTLVTNAGLFLFATDPVNKKILFNSKGSQAGAQWGAWQEFGGTTDVPLAAISFDNSFHFFRKNVGDNKIHIRSVTTVPGENTWKEFGGTTDAAVSAAVLQNKLYVFSKGVIDKKIYVRTRIAGGSWGVWKEFGGTTDAAPCAVTVKDKLYVFAKGIVDKQLYVCWKKFGGKWNTWQPFGTITTDVPVAAVAFADDLHVFVKGLADDRLYSCFIGREDKCSDWYPVPVVFDTTDTSVAVANFGGTLQLFQRWNLDQKIYTKSMFIYKLPFEDVSGWSWGRGNWDEQEGGHGPGDQSLDFDFDHAEGANVLAVRGGRVVFLANHDGNTKDPNANVPGYGTCIHIKHDGDGSTAFYMHLKFNSPKVTCQQVVKQGDVIALSGNTGQSDGPHVHLGLQSYTNFTDDCRDLPTPDTGPHMPMYFKDKLHTAAWRPAKGDAFQSNNTPP